MFIIAEVGSNWSTKDDCFSSIQKAKACGADAVKFQLFSSEELYGSDIRPLSSALPREWIPQLYEEAKQYGIEFMCTPFSEDGLRYLDLFVKRHKIASSDLCHVGLLSAAATTGKPIILSTGGHGEADVKYALEVLKGYRDITLLYCESAYPAYHMDLRKLDLLSKFGFPVGVSDHSREIFTTPLEAQRRGAKILEKHVNFVGAKGPDAPHSLSLSDFREMVGAIKGTGEKPQSLLSPYEQDMLLMHNRRLIAKTDISKGTKLSYENNYGVYRSTKPDTQGLHPAMAAEVHGKISSMNIQKGDPIGINSIELGK